MPASTRVMLGVKVTPEEHNEIKESAKAAGKTISDYVRPLLKQQPAAPTLDLLAAIEALESDHAVGLCMFWQLYQRTRNSGESLSQWLARYDLTSAQALKAFATSAFPEG